MKATEAAAAIRSELKSRFGWTARDVSVRADCYSMGSTLRITIKSARVVAADVERIANAHEDVRRDHASGEILCGGNRFVDVSYSDALLAALAVDDAVIPTGAESVRFAGYWIHRCDTDGKDSADGNYYRAFPRWANADYRATIDCYGRQNFARVLGLAIHARRQAYARKVAA